MPGTYCISLSLSRRLSLFIKYGGHLGAVQGVRYFSELIGRLTNSPAHRDPPPNGALLLSHVTFPLGRAMDVELSHDNVIVGNFAALRAPQYHEDRSEQDMHYPQDGAVLYPYDHREGVLPSPLTIPRTRRSRSMKCFDWITGGGADEDYEGKEEYVRILANDAIQSLELAGRQGR